MNPEDLRAYARRAWHRAEMLKREHWAGEIADRGPLATFEASQVFWEHLRHLRPDWPSPDERRDLAHHVALKHAIDRASGAAPPPIAELLAQLQRAFAGLGVRWFLFDAQAAILHGVARLSADVDVTVDLGRRSSADLVGALARAGFELRVADITGFVEATRVQGVRYPTMTA